MQNAIKFNNKIISRRGQIAKMGLKMFSKQKGNFKENRNRPPKKLFELMYKELCQKKRKKI